MNVDMHIHTSHSDGDYTAREIIEMARGLDIKYASITDHDTVAAYDELKTFDHSDITLVTAVELSSVYDAEPRDILGYGIDVDRMRKILKARENPERDFEREEILLDLYRDSFRRNGMRVDDDLKITKGRKNEAYEQVIGNAEKYPENVKKYPGITNWSAFFWANTSMKESPFYVDNTFYETSIEECVSMIHQADGLAFFAHPCIHGKNFEHVGRMLDEARGYGIDGVEVLHAKHDEKAVAFLEEYADRHHLYKSGGSDFHGSPKPDIKLLTGKGSLKVEFDMIKDWVNTARKV